MAPFQSARAISDHLRRRIGDVDAQATEARPGGERFGLDGATLPAYEQRRSVGQFANIAAAARALAYGKVDRAKAHLTSACLTAHDLQNGPGDVRRVGVRSEENISGRDLLRL